MATTPTVPAAGGGAPATPSTPAATPSTPSTPVHSSDRALDAFNSGDPARGGAAPATPAATATPAAADPAAASLPDDITSLLADDLPAAAEPNAPPAAPAADPNANPADPLAALQDNPRVKELQAAETTLKDAMSASPEWIKEPAHVKAAVQDAAVLWDITEGKQPVSVILDAAKQQSPQMFPKILADLKAYVEKETGVPIAAAAAGVPDPATMTDEQKRIAALEKEAADRKKADADAQERAKLEAFNKRVDGVKSTVTTKLDEMLKGTPWEGEGAYFFILVGNQLRGKEMQVIDAVEKGDFKLIETALKQARSAEAVRFDARVKRMREMQLKKKATVPNQPGGGPPASSEPAPASSATMDAEARKKKALELLRS